MNPVPVHTGTQVLQQPTKQEDQSTSSTLSADDTTSTSTIQTPVKKPPTDGLLKAPRKKVSLETHLQPSYQPRILLPTSPESSPTFQAKRRQSTSSQTPPRKHRRNSETLEPLPGTLAAHPDFKGLWNKTMTSGVEPLKQQEEDLLSEPEELEEDHSEA